LSVSLFSVVKEIRRYTLEGSDPVKKDSLSISIKDIARAANVSHSTVSRALSNSSLVNSETAEKIKRIARESNFRVSAVGRSLATGRTNSIGVVVTTIADPFVAEVVTAVEDTANARRYSVILASSKSDPEREMKVVQSFEERRVDGILVVGSRVGSVYIPVLSEMKIPIVLINSQHPGEFIYSVTIDNAGGGRAATRFLIQLGHKRIAYIGDRAGAQCTTTRLAGYQQALEKAGIPFRPELIARGDSSPEGGLQVTEQLLSLAHPPTAIFCYNDMMAVGALNAVHQRRLRVPEDISIIGFDDVAIASYTFPPLTTVRQPKHEMGRMATEILLNLLAGSKSETSRSVQGELIVRESTAPPPAQAAVLQRSG
jgi:DNA-binding LacI/PurR family transcriptional regulator